MAPEKEEEEEVGRSLRKADAARFTYLLSLSLSLSLSFFLCLSLSLSVSLALSASLVSTNCPGKAPKNRGRKDWPSFLLKVAKSDERSSRSLLYFLSLLPGD